MTNQRLKNLFKDPRTNWKYILIVVILGIIVSGGILVYYYMWIADLETRLAELELKLPEKKVEDETAGLSSKALATEDWKTYRNTDFGYQFKYPPDFSIHRLEPQELSFPSINVVFLQESFPPEFEAPYIVLKIQDNPTHLSPEEYYDGDPGADFFGQSGNEYTTFEVDRRPALRFEPYITYAGQVVVVVPLQDRFLVVIDEGVAYQENGVFKIILDSIQIQ